MCVCVCVCVCACVCMCVHVCISVCVHMTMFCWSALLYPLASQPEPCSSLDEIVSAMADACKCYGREEWVVNAKL